MTEVETSWHILRDISGAYHRRCIKVLIIGLFELPSSHFERSRGWRWVLFFHPLRLSFHTAKKCGYWTELCVASLVSRVEALSHYLCTIAVGGKRSANYQCHEGKTIYLNESVLCLLTFESTVVIEKFPGWIQHNGWVCDWHALHLWSSEYMQYGSFRWVGPGYWGPAML